jgi:hypothetical protein
MTTQSILDRTAGHRPLLEVQEIVTKGCEDAPELDGADFRA